MIDCRSAVSILTILTAVFLATGCVERKLMIRSDPPGGVVLVDNKIIGVTPTSMPFTFYGKRLVEVRWDPFLTGVDPFHTAKEVCRISPPWYEYFPLDFFSENLWPFMISDERVVDFKLKKVGENSSEISEARLDGVIQRAESMRARALSVEEEDP